MSHIPQQKRWSRPRSVPAASRRGPAFVRDDHLLHYLDDVAVEEASPMRRLIIAVVAAGALGFVLSAPASAAEADGHASCAGLAAASRAGQPGAQAEVVRSVLASEFPPGVNFSDFASFHEGTAEACLA